MKRGNHRPGCRHFKGNAAEMGVNLKLVSMPFAELLPALEDGRVDMVLSGMTMTPERNRKVAFVGPYCVSGKGILAVSDKFAALQKANGVLMFGLTTGFLFAILIELTGREWNRRIA